MSSPRHASIAIAILIGLGLIGAPSGRAQLSQTVITGPVGSGPGAFGRTVAFLPNGNYVVSDPLFDLPSAADVGAVHLYRGSDHALLATLTGGAANEKVGQSWGGGPGIIVLPSGHYLVHAPTWNGFAGAVTWCDGVVGCSGVVDATNSAIGSTPDDRVGDSVLVLENGNYLIEARAWDDPTGPLPDVGAVRFCDGATGCFGPFTSANARIGSAANEGTGGAGVTLLSNGNYVVYSPTWGTPSALQAGAATFCSGATGCTGTASASNSLVGTTSFDWVGVNVSPLSDGSYVVHSPIWDKGGVADAGALTWCNGVTGCPPGPVTAVDSLTGASANDRISGDFQALDSPRVVPLPGGAFVFKSPVFNLPGLARAGAVTWCGAGGAGCTGAVVTSGNSLVGSKALELQESPPLVAVGSGAFVVPVPEWDGNSANLGAVVYCDAETHCQAQTVGASNALTGSTLGDQVGATVIALANGNYVVVSPQWNRFGQGGIHTVGAATFCSGTSGCQGPVTVANSFTSTSQVGNDLLGHALSNGNYVVTSRQTYVGGILSGFGAAAFCSGTVGCFGTYDAANALTVLDGVGRIHPLPSGDYLVVSPDFDDGATANAGAITSCSGTSGCVGNVTSSNSQVGVATNDRIGFSGLSVFADGRFAVQSGLFDNGPIANAGAITLGHDAAAAPTGPIDATNSVFGSVPGDLPSGFWSIDYDAERERFALGAAASNRVIIVDVPEPGVSLALAVGCAVLGRFARRRDRSNRPLEVEPARSGPLAA